MRKSHTINIPNAMTNDDEASIFTGFVNMTIANLIDEISDFPSQIIKFVFLRNCMPRRPMYW